MIGGTDGRVEARDLDQEELVGGAGFHPSNLPRPPELGPSHPLPRPSEAASMWHLMPDGHRREEDS